ncbi:MAG: hypothetical protein R3A79_07775 [Nannocystaceae bacterium]
MVDEKVGRPARRRLDGRRRSPTRAVWLAAVVAGLTACAPPLLVRRSATIPLAPCDPREPATHERPRAIAGGDLDGDGHGDLVIVSADPLAEDGAFARARVIWWDERGACLSPAYDAWSAPPPLTAWDASYARRPRPPLTATMVAEVLDVDGDGRLDLLSADAATLELSVAYGRGDRASPFEPPIVLRVDDPPAIIPTSDLPATRQNPRNPKEKIVRVCPSTIYHWLALGDSEAEGRHDLHVDRRGLFGSCSPGALLFTAEGERGFAAGRFVGEFLAPAVPPRSRRYGNIFATNAADHVSLEDGEITLHEGIIVNQDQRTTRELRVRQPFAAELVVVADLGERRPRYYGAEPRPEDAPIHRVIIADDRSVAALRDNPANLSWRWTIFELP